MLFSKGAGTATGGRKWTGRLKWAEKRVDARKRPRVRATAPIFLLLVYRGRAGPSQQLSKRPRSRSTVDPSPRPCHPMLWLLMYSVHAATGRSSSDGHRDQRRKRDRERHNVCLPTYLEARALGTRRRARDESLRETDPRAGGT